MAFFCPCSPLLLLPAFGLSNARDVVYIGIDPLVVVSSTNSNLQKRQWAFLLLESSAGVMLVFWFFCHGLITVLSQVKDVGFEIISWLLSPNICKGRGEEEVLFEQCFFCFAFLSKWASFHFMVPNNPSHILWEAPLFPSSPTSASYLSFPWKGSLVWWGRNFVNAGDDRLQQSFFSKQRDQDHCCPQPDALLEMVY